MYHLDYSVCLLRAPTPLVIVYGNLLRWFKVRTRTRRKVNVYLQIILILLVARTVYHNTYYLKSNLLMFFYIFWILSAAIIK